MEWLDEDNYCFIKVVNYIPQVLTRGFFKIL